MSEHDVSKLVQDSLDAFAISLDEMRSTIHKLSRITENTASMLEKWSPQVTTDDQWKKHPPRMERIDEQILQYLDNNGIDKGLALEIGGRQHSHRSMFEERGMDYIELDLESRSGVVVGDITNCPQLESESYDVIISIDVFEHIKEPWKAAREISRLLKPGGLSYTSTLFSWRYHPCPVDYWRFSPDCLEFLFGQLETVGKGFDTVERRRNITGVGLAGPPLELDGLGGWRENWRVYHVGVKSG